MIGLTKSRVALQRISFNRAWQSSFCNDRPSSQQIRQQFLDFFVKDKEHAFVRSSPVVPFCDPTVAFVNAGMNQVGFIHHFMLFIIVNMQFCFSLKMYFWERLSQDFHE